MKFPGFVEVLVCECHGCGGLLFYPGFWCENCLNSSAAVDCDDEDNGDAEPEPDEPDEALDDMRARETEWGAEHDWSRQVPPRIDEAKK
ncbi:MAG: hypothetical protein IVW56_09710 [Candidatus Binataceae bacterium]|nr:hypothetical protein [Candidatus Binataceae bacterium]